MTVLWRRLPFVIAAALVLLLAARGASAQTDPTVAEARALVDAGRATAAYEMLLPYLDRGAGDPVFDYVFALAALDSGNVSQGVFALERVLAVEPDQPQARAELARAYFLLGELDNAKSEFEAVQRTDPPPEVQDTIDRFLAEIERRQGGPQGTRFRASIGLTLGFDTNVNSAQSESLLAIPLFAPLDPAGQGNARLNRTGISQKDQFGQLDLGGSMFHRLAPDLALVGNARVAMRRNGSEEQFDTGDLRGDLGLTWQRGEDRFSAALQANRFLLDDDTFRDAYGVFGQWRRSIGASISTTTYAQVSALTYDGQRVRNANRYTVGGVLTQNLGGRLDTTVSVGAYGGLEAVRASSVEHLGHRFVGATGSARFTLGRGTTAFANAMVEGRYYGGTDPFFLVGRDDTYIRLGGGVLWEFRRNWSLTPQIVYSYNDSNVALNEYDRLLISLTLRRTFQ